MSTERTLLVRLSGNEPNAGGDWVEYHYSPIYINTGNTGIYLEHSLEVSGETRFQSGVYAGKSLSVSGLTDTDTLYISGTGSDPQLHIYSSGAGGSGWFLGSSGDGNFVIYSSGTNTGALVIEPSGDVLITGNLNISGDATVAGTFIPLGHQSVPGDFFVGSGMYISGDLSVRSGANITGTGVFHSDLIAQELEVSGTANINNLSVSGEAKIENNLYVSGFVEATGDIKTSGTGFFDKELQVGPYGNQVLIDVDQTSADFTVPIVSSGEILVEDKIRVEGTAEISGETKIQDNLLVSGDLTVSGTFVREDEVINGNLFVNKTGYFASGIVSSGVVDALSGIVSSEGITGEKSLTVSGDSSFANILSTGNVKLSGSLTNTGTIFNIGKTTISGDLDVTGNAEITGDLFVHGNVYSTGQQMLIDTRTVRVADTNIELGTGSGFGGLARSALDGGGFTLKSTDGDVGYNYSHSTTAWGTNVNYLTSGYLYAGSGVISSGTLDVSGTADISGQTKIHNNLRVKNGLRVSGALRVAQGVDFSGDGKFRKNLYISGKTEVSGALRGHSTLDISGASTLSGTLDVSGATSITGATRIEDTLKVSGATDISGALKGHSTLDISGASTLSGTLDVSGATSITGATRIENTLDVSGNIDVSGSGHFSNDVVLRNTSSGIAQASISGIGSGIRVCDWIIRHPVIEIDTINKSFSQLLDSGPSASDVISLNASVFRANDSIAYSVYSVANPAQAPDGPGYNFEISYSGKTIKVVDLDDALAIGDIVTVDLKYQS